MIHHCSKYCCRRFTNQGRRIVYWTTRAGDMIRPRDMGTSHLLNALRLQERTVHTNTFLYRFMLNEARRRGVRW